uniref:Anaphase-promoting complex subunit 4 WD40 domain-containing protein n=1 Tax=Bionectria ochroleuca TaxID=29856 RepID=A0A8H7K1E8_BIOOC
MSMYTSRLTALPAKATFGQARRDSRVLSADDKWLASGSYDKTVKVWDTATGVCLQTFEGHSHWVYSVVFSADNERLASGSLDNTIKVWDTATGVCLQTLEGHSNWVSSVVFSADGKRLASGSDDETIKVWDAATGVWLQTLVVERTPTYLSFDPSTNSRISTGIGSLNLNLSHTMEGVCFGYLQSIDRRFRLSWGRLSWGRQLLLAAEEAVY